MSTAWADYWARPQRGGGRRGGCLPEAGGALGGPLEALWREFARSLPAKARVLDLATGDGAVLRIVPAERRDLRCTGVDSAPRLPAAPAGTRLRAGVAMEALPFADGAFEAATSQFGIEYGDAGRIAAETARVLRPGGRLRAAVHHAGGAIVAHNLARREALAWAIGAGGIVEAARNIAAARERASLPTPPSFRAAVGEAQRLFPGQGAAAEIAAAVLQTLELGAARPPRETLEVLATLEARARGEMARIGELERAARDGAGIAALAAAFAAAGFAVDPPRAVEEAAAGGRPIAWLLDARRQPLGGAARRP